MAAGGNCTVTVTFTPTTDSGTYTDTLTVDESASANGGIVTAPLSANAGPAAAPAASLSPNPLAFSGEIANTISGTLSVTLSNTGNALLTGIAPSLTGANPGDFSIGTGTNACGSTLVAGSSCSIYLTFTPISATGFTATLSVADNSSGSPQTVSLTGTGVVFSSNVGTAQATQTMAVYMAAAGTLNSIQVLTQGAANLDFTMAAGGTCATTTAYTVGQSCTVNVIFDPQVPRARPGAVLLTDASNDVLGTTYLPGIGFGPELVFGPGVQSTLPNPTYASGWQSPSNIAVDSGLNVYVADTSNNAVAKIPWSGTSYGTPVKLPFVGLNQPEAVAVDGAGNVFITDTENFQILELPWNGSSYGAQIILDQSFLPDPDGIVVDGNGNLFFTDGLDQKLVEMPWTSSGYGSPTTIAAASGLHSPHGLAVDANLNIYIADSDNSRVVEIPWNGTTFGAEIEVANASNNGLFYPESAAVDAAGDVYIADFTHGRVVEEPWNGSAFGTQIAVPLTFTGGAIITGIAVAGNGNLYSSDSGDNVVVELNASTPPSLTFSATNVGSTSTDSPQTVSVTNIGNVSSYLPIPSSGDNPTYPVNFPINSSDPNLCAEDDSIRTGSSCDVSVNFTPTASGPLSSNVVITDNQLNQNSAKQSIPVSGTGTGGGLIAQAINFTQPASPVTYSSGLQFPLSATGGASGNPIVFTLDGSSTGTGSISGATLTVTGVGSFVIDANQAGNSNYSAAPQVRRTVAIAQAAQAIDFTQPTSPVNYSSGLQILLSATGGASGNPVVFTLDGSSTGTGSISGTTLTVTGVGSFVIDANQAGNSNYSAAPQVQRMVVVNTPAPSDFTIGASPAIQTVAAGAAASYPVTVGSSSGSFSSAVTLSVTGLPTGATASFSPPQVTPGDGSAASTMTVDTPALLVARWPETRPGSPLAIPALALLFLLPFRRWRRTWSGKLLLLAVGLASLAAAASLSACGGGFGFNPPQTYTLAVTGTSGSDTHSTTVKLTVQ